MLVVGVLLSTAGAALAVSGNAGDGSAGTAQYAGPSEDRPGSAGKPETLGGPPGGGGENPGKVAAPEGGRLGDSGTSPARSNDQVAASGGGGDLPFTGFAAIPIVVAGICLLVTGLLLRRRVD